MADLAEMIRSHADRIPTQLSSLIQHDSDEKKEYNWRQGQNIRVIARFRPSNRVEKEYSRKHGIRDQPPDINNNIITLTQPSIASHRTSHSRKQRRMKYRSNPDHVLNTNTNQKEVFKIVGQPLIHDALHGFNATLLAYGQTGSGKTYSMFGANDGSGIDLEAMGLIPRSFVYLFDQLQQRCNNQTIQNFSVSIQSLQIYNKQLLDLLKPNSKTSLLIKTDFTNNNNVFVQHLHTIQITSAREALAVLIESAKNRIVASHKLDIHSSRSHMLILLKVKQIKIDGSSTMSNISFVDLAGSDVISSKGKNDGKRLEGASLSALTRCVNSLVKGQHPPYRDSPLTHLLQDSVGGNSKTTLLVCASPHIFNRNETIRTLRFGATAKEVKNKAKKNEETSDINSIYINESVTELIQSIYSSNRDLVTGYIRQTAFNKYNVTIPPAIIDYIILFLYYESLTMRIKNAEQRWKDCGRVAAILGGGVCRLLEMAQRMVLYRKRQCAAMQMQCFFRASYVRARCLRHMKRIKLATQIIWISYERQQRRLPLKKWIDHSIKQRHQVIVFDYWLRANKINNMSLDVFLLILMFSEIGKMYGYKSFRMKQHVYKIEHIQKSITKTKQNQIETESIAVKLDGIQAMILAVQQQMKDETNLNNTERFNRIMIEINAIKQSLNHKSESIDSISSTKTKAIPYKIYKRPKHDNE